MSSKTIRVGIFVDIGFSMLVLSQILGSLQAANRVQRSGCYVWSVVSADGGGVRSEEGPSVTTDCISSFVTRPRSGERLTFSLLSGCPADAAIRRAILKAVRETVVHGGRIIAVGDASAFLADVGILAGRRCAVHWSNYGTLLEKYPGVMMTRNYYEIDGPYHTSAGELATVDLMLRVVEEDCGLGVAEEATQLLLPGDTRSIGQRQAHPNSARMARRGSALRQIVEKMEDNIAEPLSLDVLVKGSSLSRRQIERHFENQTGLSPKRYYMLLRLQRAQDLLRHSIIPVVDIAVATGFVSQSHFSKAYKVQFGESPIVTRRLASGARRRSPLIGLDRAQNDNAFGLKSAASEVISARVG